MQKDFQNMTTPQSTPQIDQNQLAQLQQKYQAKQAEMDKTMKELGFDDNNKRTALAEKYAKDPALQVLFVNAIVESAKKGCNLDENNEIIKQIKENIAKGQL